ncbi:class E sortase [Actinomadura sp. WMMB 499]|uniref:class E sortase n=1 Tax=Actinomadura sp. WMMB 499 TaxID=1219491 RepID=UPI001247E00D|nr:class E sortase [Actinomadura sp. WMMB 499]QFG23692.1 class E sortase [Actinomadura sp. WMMB 499]
MPLRRFNPAAVPMAAALAVSVLGAPGARAAAAPAAPGPLADPVAAVSSVTSVLELDPGRAERAGPAAAPAGAPGGTPAGAAAGAEGRTGADRPRPGERIASLAIDRISVKAKVFAGVEEQVLQHGVGHYPGTARPGEQGNTVLLGHRTTHLHPFLDLDKLKRGDAVELRAGGRTHVYRVQDKRVTMPDDRSALEPVPYRPWSPPDGAYVTLITCHPKGSDARRLIVVARRAS